MCLLFLCCSDKGTSTGEKQAISRAGLVYETKILKKELETPAHDSDESALIEFQYPEIQRAPNTSALESLKNSINDFLLNPVYQGSKPDTVEENMEDFLEKSQKFFGEFPDSYRHYYIKRTVSIVHEESELACLEFTEDFYTGGAHPNAHRVYKNFNLATGELIKLDEIFNPGYEVPLRIVAEKEFRQSQGLSPEASLKKAGYFFEDDKFFLNNNFMIGGRGITFYYNNYEIAPYALGPTVLTLDYESIKDLIDKEGLLADIE
jgi:hypothetical protein